MTPRLKQLAGLVLALPAVWAGAQTEAPAPAGRRFAEDHIRLGKEQFDRTCAQCHGRNMVNSGTTIYDLRKFPVNQKERFITSVSLGKGNMPSFKDALSADQLQVLWAYVGSRGGKEP